MKIIKISAAVLICAFVFFAAAAISEKYKKAPQPVGMKTFADSLDVSPQNGKIVLTGKENDFSFAVEDGAWRVEQCGGYFADYNMISMVIYMLNSSRLYNYAGEEIQFVPDWKIEVFEGGKLLNSAEVMKNEDNRYLAKVSGSDKIYEMTQMYDFPQSCDIWLKQPLVALQQKDISSVDTCENVFSRDDDEEDFAVQPDEKNYLDGLFKELSNFKFITALPASDNNEFSSINELRIETFGGLIIKISLMQKDGKYYVSVTPDTTVVPLAGLREYVENNKVLYDGWLFEISENQAKIFMPMQKNIQLSEPVAN